MQSVAEACAATKDSAKASLDAVKMIETISNSIDDKHKSYIAKEVKKCFEAEVTHIEDATNSLLKPLRETLAKHAAFLDNLETFKDMTPDSQNKLIRATNRIAGIADSVKKLRGYSGWLKDNLFKLKR